MGKEIEKEAEEWAEGRFDYRDYKDARFKLDHPIEGYVRGYLAARLKYEVKIAEAYLAGFEGAKRTAQPRWISVKERLPSDGEYTLIYMAERPITRGRVELGVFENGDWHDWAYDVTHWLSIPPAPEEEE